MKTIIKPFQMLKRIIEKLFSYLRKSIRLQLITTFIVCILLGFFASRLVAPIFKNINKEATIDYTQDIESIDWQAKLVAEKSTEEDSIELIEEKIKDEDEHLNAGQETLKILVANETGKIIYKTSQAQEKQINLHDKINEAMSFSINQSMYTEEDDFIEGTNKEFTAFYPLTIKNENLYLFVSKTPEGNIIYHTKEGVFPLLIGIFVFMITYYYATRKKMEQIEAMAQGVETMAKGDLTYRIHQEGQDEVALLTKSINQMAEELLVSIEKERKFEQQKYILITNISHDLRTPLTSVMGYLRLLYDKKFENEEQFTEYIGVAYAKAEQLKDLLEDLFEYTKLIDKDVKLNIEKVCINKLLTQLIDEFTPQLMDSGLSIKEKIPNEFMYCRVDPEKTARLFDNLLINAIQHSTGNGEILVSMQKEKSYLEVAIENDSEKIKEEDLENIFERFYQIDKSRGNLQESSGLGLAIAKNIAEMQEGQIKVSYKNGRIRFTVLLPLVAE